MDNVNGFIPTQEIFNPEELIGRNKTGRELDTFIKGLTQNKSNIQLISERRTGKSSLLNCAAYEIQSGKFGKNYIPLIVNFKKYPYINDINKGYSLICSKLLHSINNLDVWEKSGFIKKKDTIVLNNSNVIYKQFTMDEYYNFILHKDYHGSYLFESLILFLAQNSKSVLLLVDEYESMFFNTFGGSVGSVHTIRDLTMKELANDQIFRCSITGARSWDKYSQKIGSDDFNFIDDYLHLKPLSYDESFMLFEKYHNNSSGICKSNLIEWEKEIENIFEMSGGNPYLIKIIGNTYASTGKIDLEKTQKRLNSHFCNIWQRLSEKEHKVLQNNSVDHRVQNDVIDYGLAFRKSKKAIEPLGSLWSNYISSVIETENIFDSGCKVEPKIVEIHQIGSDVIDLITDINDILHGKAIEIIFNTKESYKYPKYSNQLTILIEDKTIFTKFISSLYFIFFESTQGYLGKKKRRIVNCARYPIKFNRANKNEPLILSYIDALRHKVCNAHDVASDNFNPPFTHIHAQYHFLSHKNNISNSEYYIIQKGILKELIVFLSNLKKWAEVQT